MDHVNNFQEHINNFDNTLRACAKAFLPKMAISVAVTVAIEVLSKSSPSWILGSARSSLLLCMALQATNLSFSLAKIICEMDEWSEQKKRACTAIVTTAIFVASVVTISSKQTIPLMKEISQFCVFELPCMAGPVLAEVYYAYPAHFKNAAVLTVVAGAILANFGYYHYQA